MVNSIYSLVETHVVSQMTPVITLTEIETISGTPVKYKLYTCNTQWVTLLDKITIDGVIYKVVDFVQNEYLVVTGSTAPVQLYFQLSAPRFEHGTHRRVNSERSKQKEKRVITPMIYMLPVKGQKKKTIDSLYGFHGKIRFFFLTTFDSKGDQTITTQQKNVVDPMAALAQMFFNKMEERQDIFAEVEDIFQDDYMDFGDPEIWGAKERIFTEFLSGVGAIADAKIYSQALDNDCCAQSLTETCLPVNLLINSTFEDSTPSGTNYNITLVDTDGNTPTYTFHQPTKKLTVSAASSPIDITANGDLVFNQVTTNQELSIRNTAGTEKGALTAPGVWTVENSTAVFKNSLGVTIISEDIPAGDSEDIPAADVSWTDSDGSAESTPYGSPIVCTPAIPPPTAGLYIPLTWTGANVVNYTFGVPSTAANNFNTISRAATGGTSFLMNIFSVQTMSAAEDWVISGDDNYNATASKFWGFGLQSITGVDFSNIDFCFFVTTGGVINWRQSGVDFGNKATLTAGNYWSWRLEYNGTTKDVKLYINGILVHTAATGYAAQTLVVKHCGRNGSQLSSHHIALIKTPSSNRILVPFGDSITFGRAIISTPGTGFPGHNYIEKAVSYSNHKYFVNPVLARAGDTTALLISQQLPLASVFYNAAYTSNVASVMIGINDIRTGVPLATIQANMQTIVSTLQGIGYFVLLHTIPRDFNTAWADRPILNTWALAGNSGADMVVDHTTSIMETDDSYFETDKLHPNANGMTQIAFETYPYLLLAP